MPSLKVLQDVYINAKDNLRTAKLLRDSQTALAKLRVEGSYKAGGAGYFNVHLPTETLSVFIHYAIDRLTQIVEEARLNVIAKHMELLKELENAKT